MPARDQHCPTAEDHRNRLRERFDEVGAAENVFVPGSKGSVVVIPFPAESPRSSGHPTGKWTAAPPAPTLATCAPACSRPSR